MELVSQEMLVVLTISSLETLKRLGVLAEFVEVIRITFSSFGTQSNGVPGPCFAVYFHDPLNNKCSFSTDYRFLGSGSTTPTIEEVVVGLMDYLPKTISEFIKKTRAKIEQAQETYKKLDQRLI